MNIALDCVPCLVRQAIDSARRVTGDTRVHEEILRSLLRMSADLDFALAPPYVSQQVHRWLRERTGVLDPYREAKTRMNELALRALPALSSAIELSHDPLRTAARFAVAANALDLGTDAKLTEEEMQRALRGGAGDIFFGDFEAFRRAAARAQKILYLADNAGEIAVDRLATEQLGPRRVTVVVRGKPVLNDATLEDARQVGLTDLVRVIDNGSDAPGTILDECSPAFVREFEDADLIIAKGQGNFETLSHVRRPIAFWFKVKCKVVAAHARLPIGTYALLPPQE